MRIALDLLSKLTSPCSAAPTVHIGVLTKLRADIAAERWAGTGVVYGRRSNGRVTATCLGVTGVGRTEVSALLDMERRLIV